MILVLEYMVFHTNNYNIFNDGIQTHFTIRLVKYMSVLAVKGIGYNQNLIYN